MTEALEPRAARWVLNPTSGRTAGRQASRKGARPRAIGRKKGGLNAGLRMLSDGPGRPPTVVLSPGRMHDLQGALVLPGALPTARLLPGQRGCDAARFRKDPADTGMPPASRPGAEARHPPATTGHSTSQVTGSRLFSCLRRTGAGSPPALTEAANASRRRLLRGGRQVLGVTPEPGKSTSTCLGQSCPGGPQGRDHAGRFDL
jgi:hypothetical protein